MDKDQVIEIGGAHTAPADMGAAGTAGEAAAPAVMTGGLKASGLKKLLAKSGGASAGGERKLTSFKPVPGHRHLIPVEQFYAFHEANPHIYWHLHAMAHKMKLLGYKTASIRFMVEKLRWDAAVQADAVGHYSIPSAVPPYYARALMEADASLAGFFTTKKTHRSKLVEAIDLVRMGLIK